MENNYASTVLAVAQFILDNAPEGLKVRDAERLQRVIGGKEDWYSSVDWRRKVTDSTDADATLSFELRRDYDTDGLLEDAEGNTWARYNVQANVSWPSYGGHDAKTSAARIQLMKEVCDLALAIEERFSGPVHQLIQTAAEKAESEARREEQRIKNLSESIVADSAKEALKGARVGSERIIRTERLSNLPHGRYEVTVKDKKFTLIHTGDVYANVVRTA